MIGHCSVKLWLFKYTNVYVTKLQIQDICNYGLLNIQKIL